ncbi:MAG: hypothetical protein OEW67_04325 [Cyclobacteriaceae bacterium]|nr:hypothetical protein [Cyclobacteriaceae bacterium]
MNPTGTAKEIFQYFYHPDHLGSTSYMTDASGEVYQHLEYFAFGETFVEEHNNTDNTPYLFNGKELDEETGLYYYGARYYDSQTSIMLSVDQMADKYPGISPYAYTYNNPVNYIDPTGKEGIETGGGPSKREAAAMAAHVYGDKSDKILKGGWKVSKRDFGIEKNNKNGFKSQVYERTAKRGENKGTTEYTYATAGTEDTADAIADAIQPLGLSSQYKLSKKNAKSISNQVGAENSLTFTGHSLGGGQAAANAYSTGRNAITFNAAGVSGFTKLANPDSKIEAYIMWTDPLNAIQNNSDWMPNVNGNRHYLYSFKKEALINGHSMDNILDLFQVYDRSGDIY